MVLYLSIIFFVGFILSLTNALWGVFDVNALYVILWVVLSILLSILIDGLVALLIRFIPEKKFNPFNNYFKERKNERKFYEKLKIRVWKDNIPQLDVKLKYFDKSKVVEKPTSDYFMKFIVETCMGEIMHVIAIFTAPLLLLMMPSMFILTIGLPVMIVNILLQIPPIMTQRYTRPKLLVAYKRAKITEERNENKASSSEFTLQKEESKSIGKKGEN